MSLDRTTAAARVSGTRRPLAGRGGTLVTNIGIAAVAIVLAVALAAPPPLHGQDDHGWVGKRVVQKLSNFTLRQNGEAAPRTERLIRVYVVERVFGPTVWLHAEGNGPTGWAPGDQVVPIDQAIEFFTNQVRVNPRDAFSYVMRGRVWRDRREIDKAMADYTEAIGLDPQSALTHLNRGDAWSAKLDYDKAIADYTEAIRIEPKDATGYFSRGVLWARRLEFDKAIADFSDVLGREAGNVDAYIERARVWHFKARG